MIHISFSHRARRSTVAWITASVLVGCSSALLVATAFGQTTTYTGYYTCVDDQTAGTACEAGTADTDACKNAFGNSNVGGGSVFYCTNPVTQQVCYEQTGPPEPGSGCKQTTNGNRPCGNKKDCYDDSQVMHGLIPSPTKCNGNPTTCEVTAGSTTAPPAG